MMKITKSALLILARCLIIFTGGIVIGMEIAK